MQQPKHYSKNVLGRGMQDDIDDELEDPFSGSDIRKRVTDQPDSTQLAYSGSHELSIGAAQEERKFTVEPVADRQKPKPDFDELDDLADLEDLMEGGATENGNAKQFLQEAYCLVFKDDFTQFSSSMHNAYNNSVQSTIETRKFLQSSDLSALFLKNEIMYSAKLALHLSMDKFVMADFDLESGEELKKLIQGEYG